MVAKVAAFFEGAIAEREKMFGLGGRLRGLFMQNRIQKGDRSNMLSTWRSMNLELYTAH